MNINGREGLSHTPKIPINYQENSFCKYKKSYNNMIPEIIG